MGDIFPSHLAHWLANRMNLSCFINCLWDKTPAYNITIALVGSIASKVINEPNRILLGVGTISKNALIVYGPKKLRNSVKVMGVRGPQTRDAFLLKYGVNPEVVGDPGLYVYELFKDQVKNARSNASQLKELCFLSHEVEGKEFKNIFPEFQDVTINARGNLQDIIVSISRCKHMVSSSLHGAVFSHALSIPVMVIKVSNKIAGGDWKYFDYYYGINVTAFLGRFEVNTVNRPKTKQEWINKIKEFPQPSFPFDTQLLTIFEIFQSIFNPPTIL